MPDRLATNPYVSYTLKFCNEKGELVEENYFTEQIDGKRTEIDFGYLKHFTIHNVNENLLYYWLKNNVG